MTFVADFHIHSKYSLATAKDMDIGSLAAWAKIKGISMLGTGDFTHPAWFRELERDLEKAGNGVYTHGGIAFVLTAEVSNIYNAAGRTRKVHNMIFAPSFLAAAEVNKALSDYGRLASDGRPILKLACDRMVKMLSAIDPAVFVVPSHAWTPHFGVFGSKSGFDSLDECYADQASKIFALETGLSSDPGMNWRWSKLDSLSLISNSDAHSPSKIGREANVFSGPIDYQDLTGILKTKDRKRFLYTIEFFPEQGKYHWDGHRACVARMPPAESTRRSNICPVCGKPVTIGVAHRVEELADRPEGFVLASSPPYRRVVGLAEILAEAFGTSPASKKVRQEYNAIVERCGSELEALLETGEERLRRECPAKVAQGIMNARQGKVSVAPGYDGEYGTVQVCG